MPAEHSSVALYISGTALRCNHRKGWDWVFFAWRDPKWRA